ncbi:MAG: hypothetical protein QOE19_3681 [Actinomycetota bacterium]|nr:hypothetical protein [Actinomycetota bacterium]
MTGGYLYHRRIAELAAAHDARVTFFSLPDRPFPLPALSGPSVLRAATSAPPDVLLLDSIAAAFVGPWVRSRRVAVPLVAILHQPPGGIDHGPRRARVQAMLDRLAYAGAARLLVASAALGEAMRAEGVPDHLLRVVPPGRDVACSAVPPSGDLRSGRRAAVLSVGNWVERKGLLELLEAVGCLPEDLVTLHLVGDSRPDPAYAARVRTRLAAGDLTGRVVVHGPKTIEETAGFYRAADIFALASLREPYGTVYGEAMAAGLPVVGWAAGNLPRLARDGVEGFAVTPGDELGLVTALRRLAEDEPLRRRMGGAAGHRAESFPTWDETAGLLFAELRAVVRERSS